MEGEDLDQKQQTLSDTTLGLKIRACVQIKKEVRVIQNLLFEKR